MTFGQRLRELRRGQHLTQRQLADAAEVDFTYISKIENNRLEFIPSEDLIRKLAKVLHANPEELLDLAGKFDPKALQDIVSGIPEAGVLLRRLQQGKVSRQQIQSLLDDVE